MKCTSNLLSPVLAILSVCAAPAVMTGADDPQATKPVGKAATPATPLIVVHNPDGTFTIQKVPTKEAAKDPKVKTGLVIPPQVVVPLIPRQKRN